MAGRQTLTLSIEVRILVPQPIVHPADFKPRNFKFKAPEASRRLPGVSDLVNLLSGASPS